MDFSVKLSASGKCDSQTSDRFPVVFLSQFPQPPVVPTHATGMVECGSGNVEESGQVAYVGELS